MTAPLKKSRFQAGFTLTELLIGMGVFIVGASIAYPLLISDLNLYTRNFSLNKSNNSLRYALQQLKRDVDMAAQPPVLMGYALTGNNGVLTPLAASVNSAEAILLWVNVGATYDMVPAGSAVPGIDGGTKCSVNPNVDPSTGGLLNGTTVTLNRHIDTVNPGLSAAVPQVGDRLVFTTPTPGAVNMPEVVNMNGATINKPGRLITAVSIPQTDVTSTQFTVTINTLPTPAGGIPLYKSVYVEREVAYVAYTVYDAFGNPSERQLLCYPTTATMNVCKLLIRDLDPTPLSPDARSGSTMTFNYLPGGVQNLAPLMVNLPIRAVDYAHAIGDRNQSQTVVSAGQTVDTSSTEFNIFLRSNPWISIKTRLN